MTISYSNFFVPTVLTTSAETLYAVPSSPASTLLRGARIRLTNTTAAAVTATLHSVPSAGSPVAGNAFLYAYPVPANNYIDVDVPIMPPGSSIQALASAATSITAHMIAGSLFA